MKLYLAGTVCFMALVPVGCRGHWPLHKQPALAPSVDSGPVKAPAADTKKPAQTTDAKPAAPAAPDKTATASTATPAAPEKPAQEQPAKPAPKQHKKPAPAPAQNSAPAAQATPATPPPNQVASSGQPAESAIGQLSSGDPSSSSVETTNSLNTTERNLNNIKRTLSTQEQKTAADIREYIKQARAALASGDQDGARTLATKARLLLAELNPQQ